jgi:hypothetical protein
VYWNGHTLLGSTKTQRPLERLETQAAFGSYKAGAMCFGRQTFLTLCGDTLGYRLLDILHGSQN